MKLQEYFAKMNDACTVATVLDPRMRLGFYESWERQNKTADEDHSAILGKVREAMLPYKDAVEAEEAAKKKEVEDKQGKEKRMRSEAGETSRLNPERATPGISSRIFIADDDEDDAVEDELEKYAKQRRSKESVDPHMFWFPKEGEGNEWRILALTARDYLSVCATSADSERAFSRGRHTVSEFRHSLGPETIEATQCLKSWLQMEEFEGLMYAVSEEEMKDEE
jgi:hypothetical protein